MVSMKKKRNVLKEDVILSFRESWSNSDETFSNRKQFKFEVKR